MPIVTCAWTGEEMLIDEPGGVAYITHANGDITCVYESKEEAIASESVEEQPSEEFAETPKEGE
jgi:hypothetical protein